MPDEKIEVPADIHRSLHDEVHDVARKQDEFARVVDHFQVKAEEWQADILERQTALEVGQARVGGRLAGIETMQGEILEHVKRTNGQVTRNREDIASIRDDLKDHRTSHLMEETALEERKNVLVTRSAAEKALRLIGPRAVTLLIYAAGAALGLGVLRVFGGL